MTMLEIALAHCMASSTYFTTKAIIIDFILKYDCFVCFATAVYDMYQMYQRMTTTYVLRFKLQSIKFGNIFRNSNRGAAVSINRAAV